MFQLSGFSSRVLQIGAWDVECGLLGLRTSDLKSLAGGSG